MILIYFLSTGEIYEIGTGWKTIEEFYGYRSEDMKKILGYKYVEYDRFLYENTHRFKIDVNTKELVLHNPPDYLKNIINN